MRPGSARASGSGNTATRATDAEGPGMAKTESPAASQIEAAGLLVLDRTGTRRGPARSAYFETALNAFTWPWPLNEL